MQFIQTSQAPSAIGPYSQGIVSPPFLFVSGQIGLHPETGRMVGPEFGVQARRAIENMRAIVEATGATLSDVLSVDVFVTDIKKFEEFNAIYTEYFDRHKPARAVVEVAGLPRDALVEIRAVARVGGA